MTLEQGTIVAAGMGLLSGIAYLMHLNNRVEMHERQLEDNQSQHDEFRETNDRAHDRIEVDLRYIRDRIDRALNGSQLPPHVD